MTVDEFIAQLAKNDCVDAIAVIGSAAEDSLNLASDYDLLIVLNYMPVPMLGGVTLVDGRIVDIIFTTPTSLPTSLGRPLQAILRLIAAPPAPRSPL